MSEGFSLVALTILQQPRSMSAKDSMSEGLSQSEGPLRVKDCVLIKDVYLRTKVQLRSPSTFPEVRTKEMRGHAEGADRRRSLTAVGVGGVDVRQPLKAVASGEMNKDARQWPCRFSQASLLFLPLCLNATSYCLGQNITVDTSCVRTFLMLSYIKRETDALQRMEGNMSTRVMVPKGIRCEKCIQIALCAWRFDNVLAEWARCALFLFVIYLGTCILE